MRPGLFTCASTALPIGDRALGTHSIIARQNAPVRATDPSELWRGDARFRPHVIPVTTVGNGTQVVDGVIEASHDLGRDAARRHGRRPDCRADFMCGSAASISANVVSDARQPRLSARGLPFRP